MVQAAEDSDVQHRGRVVWRRESAPQRQSTFYFPTAGDLLAKPIPQRRDLLRPWLREQESTLLFADSGQGKSFVALSIAIAIAGGGQLYGWQVGECRKPEGWRVVFVDGENNEGDIQERLRGLLAGVDPDVAARALQNLRFLSRQGQDENGADFPLVSDQEGAAFYSQLVRDCGADLIIFDNFSTLGEVEDEDKASSFNSITRTLLELKRAGVATILVHHTGKSGEDFRGSSKLKATFEVILKLEPMEPPVAEKENNGVRPAAFVTDFRKMRSGKTPAAVAAWLKNEQLGRQVRLTWQYEVADDWRLQRILRGMRQNEWSSQKEIAAVLGVSEPTVSRLMAQGERLGLWAKLPSKRRLPYAIQGIGVVE